MTIDSAYQYGSYYQNYRSEIKQVSVDEVKQQDKQQLQAAQEDISTLQQEYRQQEDTRSRSADLENISLTFCKNDTYDYIGKDASLENLDMMSAISDMQKDKVLEQYQYFVKPKDVLLSDVDGTVIQKINAINKRHLSRVSFLGRNYVAMFLPGFLSGFRLFH